MKSFSIDVYRSFENFILRRLFNSREAIAAIIGDIVVFFLIRRSPTFCLGPRAKAIFGLACIEKKLVS